MYSVLKKVPEYRYPLYGDSKFGFLFAPFHRGDSKFRFLFAPFHCGDSNPGFGFSPARVKNNHTAFTHIIMEGGCHTYRGYLYSGAFLCTMYMYQLILK